MIYLVTAGIVIIIITRYLIRTYKEIDELKNLRESSFENINTALNQRYNVMEDLINFSKNYINDENRFIVKLLQAKLLPVDQKLEVENNLVRDFKNLLNGAIESEMFDNSQEFSNLRVKIAKSEKILYESLDGLNRRTMAYNKKIVSVPSNLVAFLAKFRPLKVYEIEYISR